VEIIGARLFCHTIKCEADHASHECVERVVRASARRHKPFRLLGKRCLTMRARFVGFTDRSTPSTTENTCSATDDTRSTAERHWIDHLVDREAGRDAISEKKR
jgi:hypothetical protein